MNLIRLIIVFFGVCCSFAQADLYPNTKIKHDPAPLLAPGHRTLLEADITDPARVDQARCYFRLAASAEYYFTPMTRTVGNTYSCSLPAAALASSSLEYLIVVKNKQSQVIRSRIYHLQIRAQDVLPPQQRSANQESTLEIFDELDANLQVPTNISDKKLKFVRAKNKDDLFGLKIDIYSNSQVPTTLDVMPGYFGGFFVDENGDIYPVEGYAVDIKPKELSQSDFFLHVLHEDPLNLTDDSWEGIFTVRIKAGRNRLPRR